MSYIETTVDTLNKTIVKLLAKNIVIITSSNLNLLL